MSLHPALPLRLNPALSTQLCAHAIACFPEECCGILIEDAQGVLRFEPWKNLQNLMHAREPERYPRDARTAYFIDPLALDQRVSALPSTGARLAGIVHSHPSYPAYFSRTDREAAAPFGFPTFDDTWQLVISVYAEGVRDMKVFVWDALQETFVEGMIEELPILLGPLAEATMLEEPEP